MPANLPPKFRTAARDFAEKLRASFASAPPPDLHHFHGSFGGKDVIPLWRDAAGTQPNLPAGVRERVVVHYPEGGCALGRDGVWDEHGSVRLPADYIIGAAGAGDAFTAGALLGWHEGRPVREWLRQGVCAAAANLRDETCTGGMQPLAECLALGARYGFRG